MEAASCQICAGFAARDVRWAELSRVDARRSYGDGRPGLSDLTRRSNTSANARCRRRRRRPLQAANVSACGGAALRRPGCRVNVTWSRYVHLSRARLTSMHATRVCRHASTRPDPAGRGTAGRGRPGGTSGRAAASGYVRMRG